MNLILFRGRPGTGKTTLTHAFAARKHFPVLRKDDIYDPASEYVKDHNEKNKLSHAVLYKILESNVHADTTFILDFPFQNKEDYTLIKEWSDQRSVKLKSILVTCSDEKIWAERFNKRAENPAPNQLITDFEDLKKHYGLMQLVPEVGELLLDTINSIDDLIDAVEDFI